MVNVTVEAGDGAGNPALVKFQGETWELNIRAAIDELLELAGIEETDWDRRRTLRVGTCAGVPAWWHERDGIVRILVGSDDEAWDLSVAVPLGAVRELLGELGETPGTALPASGPGLF